MKIVTHNMNGIQGRLETLLAWLAETQLAGSGYASVWPGQSRWNGVAILSRGSEPVLTSRGLPRNPDPRQSRYIEAAVNGLLVP